LSEEICIIYRTRALINLFTPKVFLSTSKFSPFRTKKNKNSLFDPTIVEDSKKISLTMPIMDRDYTNPETQGLVFMDYLLFLNFYLEESIFIYSLKN